MIPRLRSAALCNGHRNAVEFVPFRDVDACLGGRTSIGAVQPKQLVQRDGTAGETFGVSSRHIIGIKMDDGLARGQPKRAFGDSAEGILLVVDIIKAAAKISGRLVGCGIWTVGFAVPGDGLTAQIAQGVDGFMHNRDFFEAVRGGVAGTWNNDIVGVDIVRGGNAGLHGFKRDADTHAIAAAADVYGASNGRKTSAGNVKTANPIVKAGAGGGGKDGGKTADNTGYIVGHDGPSRIQPYAGKKLSGDFGLF